ncbi:unnamed protein product [Clonostachys rosea f. rosea IK726]|uniref:Enoyl reductase (ER) domain-containing protein n=2 Tax=Bionectria ochroleuca TaxID=29856 RepID=A0A0B7K2K3_BIOOC|nr:unnamed protein product [Clonostachys rosea f. rosea IK726]
MAIEFTVFKGSRSGDIVEAKGSREVGPTEALIKITHSGVCFTDEHYRHIDQGLGHEGVGTIVEVGSRVHEISDFKVGDRVGMGWFQKFCGHCKVCVRGRQNLCVNNEQFGTANHDQGTFATGIAWDVSALFKVPNGIASEDAGPLMCGGATVWDPLFSNGARAGDRIGIVGIGGLGHLAIQFASKMAFQVVVFSRSESKREEAMSFGATEYHATEGRDSLEGITPVDYLLITANTLPDLTPYVPILAKTAKVFPLTISQGNIVFPSLPLVLEGISIVGSPLAPVGSQRQMLEFAALHGIKPQIEKFPLTQTGITDAMQRLRDGKMRYRGVVVVP